MNPSGSDPAGAIQVALITRGGRVDAVRLTSTRRTDFSRRLFAGKPVDHLLGTLPLVFSVCATAQTSAAAQALEHAGGIEVPAAQGRARELLVAVETAREHLFRILLGWPAWLGIPPVAGKLTALGRMRNAWNAALFPGGDAFRPGGGQLRPDAQALAALFDDLNELVLLALGVDRRHWASIDSPEGLSDWAQATEAVAPRMIRHISDAGHAALGASEIAPLGETSDAQLETLLGGDAVDAFVASPVWDGAPRETGALQREAEQPLVAAQLRVSGNGLLTRQVARLVELNTTLAHIEALLGRLEAAEPAGSPAFSEGRGIAQVEAARGRLVHRVELTGGLVRDYCILAPTEWNFHAQGALAVGLLGLPVGAGLAHLAHLAQLLVDAVDPCVESRIEVREHA